MHVLVTGAASGIGRATCLRLARDAQGIPAGVAAVDIRASPELEKLADELRGLGAKALVLAGDMGDPEAPARVVSAAVEHLGGLDGVVSNAGSARSHEAERCRNRGRRSSSKRRRRGDRREPGMMQSAVVLSVVLLASMMAPGAAAGQERVIKGADGAEMVLVPAGPFLMGSSAQDITRGVAECRQRAKPENEPKCEAWFRSEGPQHRIVLDSFYIDRHEVTNAQFERFVGATRYRTAAESVGYGWSHQESDGRWQWKKIAGATWRTPGGPGTSAPPTHPVVQVAWAEADAYCRWAGERLPTEAEWEKAGRGTDGRRYPWGNEWDPSRANARRAAKGTSAVGSYPPGASVYEVHDMAGNVWEWTADWYGADYYPQSPERNPQGPSAGDHRVLRGGSWLNEPFFLGLAHRLSGRPESRSANIGFRCAKSVD